MAKTPKDQEGPFNKTDPQARAGMDAETKSFLDVARLEAEGYTDEKLNQTMGSWNAERLDGLEAAATGEPDTDGLRRLVLGCGAVLVLLIGGLGIWAKTEFDKAAAGRDALTAELGDSKATFAEQLGALEQSTTTRLTSLENTAEGRIRSASGESLRVVTGRVCPTERKWTACASGCGSYTPYSGNLVIDTSAAGFTATPQYSVTIDGSGSWIADGLNAIYNAGPKGFKLFVRREDRSAVAGYANDPKRQWCVNWVAIGK